jgi:hypothetical protein
MSFHFLSPVPANRHPVRLKIAYREHGAHDVLTDVLLDGIEAVLFAQRIDKRDLGREFNRQTGVVLWGRTTDKGTLASGRGSCTPSTTTWAPSQKLRRAEELTANAICRHFHSKRGIHHRALLHPLAIYWEKNHRNKKDHKQTRNESRPMRC